MVIGFDDEFGYLEDEQETEAVEAPIIKGSKKESLLPEEDADTEPAEEVKEEEKELEKEGKIEEKPAKEYGSVIYVVKVNLHIKNSVF